LASSRVPVVLEHELALGLRQVEVGDVQATEHAAASTIGATIAGARATTLPST
jgi:hypothetical protein